MGIEGVRVGLSTYLGLLGGLLQTRGKWVEVDTTEELGPRGSDHISSGSR